MKQKRPSLRYLFTAMFGVSCAFASLPAVSGLIINEPSAQIGWGGAGNLSQARTILSNNPTARTSVQRTTDNGYGAGAPVTLPQATSYPGSSFRFNSGSNTINNNSVYANSGYIAPLSITTGSPGVLVLDVETNQPLYEKNSEVARPIASITKLMTAMVLLDANQDMREEIRIEPIDFIGPKRASSRLQSGDRMNRAELMLMMLMKSENPAAKSLARHYPGGYDAFMAAMNQKAQSLGMTTAFFGDPTGLDSRNVASPADLARMVSAAGNYEVIRRFSTTTNYDFFVANYASGNRTYPARNTSYLVRDQLYPIGISKTGFINEAGKCVVMETRVNDRPAIIVILGARNSATRWADAENILNSLYLRRTV